jgi:hypothetical protein
MVTRIWHGATPAGKSDEYLNLMRTLAIPDYRSTPGNKGAYALRRMEGNTAHFLMITFCPRAFPPITDNAQSRAC